MIGEAVIGQACRALAEWQSAGIDLQSVAVNVSLPQVNAEYFVERTLALIEASALTPERLEIEIDEHLLVKPNPVLLTQLKALAEAGVGLAVDGFGTTYGTLAGIQRLPIRRIKVGRSLVMHSHDDPLVHRQLKSTTAVAHALRCSCVAVGVETEVQLERLRQLGFTHAQGFLLAKPVAVDAVPGLCRHYADDQTRFSAAPSETE